MLLKEKTIKQRNSLKLTALQYRLPLPVQEVLQLTNGTRYPICPRCELTIEREYMCYCDRCGQHLSWSQFENANVVFAPRRKV